MRLITRPPQKGPTRPPCSDKIKGEAGFNFLLLFLSYTFFLWMFMAAEGLERMADEGHIADSLASNPKIIAYEFAARWRHGMAGGWPLYMPGFFVTAVAAWVWAKDRPFKKLLAEGAVTTLLAGLTAKLFASAGTEQVVEAFRRETGLQCESGALGPSATGTALGIYTLITWSALVICAQRSIAGRTLRPLWLPIAMNLILAQVRPWTVGDLTTLWMQQVSRGDTAAILSLALVPIVAAFLVWHQLRTR